MTVAATKEDVRQINTRLDELSKLMAPVVEDMIDSEHKDGERSQIETKLRDAIAELERLARERAEMETNLHGELAKRDERLDRLEAGKNRRAIHRPTSKELEEYGGIDDIVKAIMDSPSVRAFAKSEASNRTAKIRVPDFRAALCNWRGVGPQLRRDDPILSGDVALDPIRRTEWVNTIETPTVLRQLIPVIPVTNSDSYEYVYQVQDMRIVDALNAGFSSGATSCVLKRSTRGFRVNSVVYFGDDKTKPVTITSIDHATKTLNFAATSFAASADDRVWSETYTYTPENVIAPFGRKRWDTKKVTLKKIMSLIPATIESLEFEMRLRALLQNQGLTDLNQSEETVFFYGSGTDEPLGIFSNTDCPQYLWSSGKSGDSKADALRRARTVVRKARIGVDAHVVSIDDLEDIDLLKTDTGDYVWGIEAFGGGAMRAMPTRLVESDTLEAGDFTTAGFGQSMEIPDKPGLSVNFTDSNNDDYEKDIITMKIRKHSELAYLRPQGVVRGKFDSQPA